RATTPRGVYEQHLPELRQTLLRADATLIGVANEDPDDLARGASVTASGFTRTIGTDAGDDGIPYRLTDDIGIVVPVTDELGGIALRIATDADTTLVVEAYVSDLPQNVIPVERVAAASVPVPAGDARWVEVPLAYTADRARNVIVVVRSDPAVTLFTTPELPPGVLTLVHRLDNDDQNVEISRDELIVQWPTKPLRGRSVLFRALRESAVLAPERAISGFNRPFDGPNMWASEPMVAGRDEWLRLDWDEPVTASEIRLVFDDDVDLELNTLHHHRSPDRVIPQLVRDYRVEVLGSDGWRAVAEVRDNRHRHRVHALPADLGPLTSARLVISATNGARQARVIAFRVQR
ncbi:MAG TPA: pyridine nucleotide-disulfide oxidoreductase, partial [Microbacterium sp.]|nr:pyridine nucleotide-disulfide oxidoreductase [Microbacterium sp.]